MRPLNRIKTWEEDYEKRRRLHFIEDSNQFISLRTFKLAVRGILLGFIILTVGGVGNLAADRERADQAREALVKSGRIVSVDACNRDFRIIQRERGVFQRSLVVITQQHDAGLTTDAQYLRSKEFYEQQLGNFLLPDCRITNKLLTDDPEQAKQPVPRPLYPGSPEENVITFDPNPNEGKARPVFPKRYGG